MSAFLCPAVSPLDRYAIEKEKFFDSAEIKTLREFEQRETPAIGRPGDSCRTDLFFGFFFDGTKNNYLNAEQSLNHSNVARLYDCYPGLSVPGVLPQRMDWQYKPSNYTHFFKTYIPGVASPFKEVGDSGANELSATIGFQCEARIKWALMQAINNVHRYFLKAPLLTSEAASAFLNGLELSVKNRFYLNLESSPVHTAGGRWRSNPGASTDSAFIIARDYRDTRHQVRQALLRLHSAVSQHWIDRTTGRPKKTDPGIVQTIHVSIFGFSRGATQARAFANWLVDICKLDARLAHRGDTMSLGGFRLEIDFLGLYDTVASVGIGNTTGNSALGKFLDGHSAWADSESNLRIPTEIRKCVHLVAAHEVRRSFPLDSVAVGNTLPANAEEVVFPGVHSDIGCGYAPGEQGRGTDPTGADMLARLPLLYMYRAARIAGTPLKLEFASDAAKQRFKVTPETIQAFNAYINDAAVKQGTLTAIMRDQAKMHIQWRLMRRANGASPVDASSSFRRATNFDRNDLHSANLEFEEEITKFENWLAQRPKSFVPSAQPPGFHNEHENEWQEIARWWRAESKPSQAVLSFFDDYVHDSRAWFKFSLSDPDSEKGTKALLQKWASIIAKSREENLREEKLSIERQDQGLAHFGYKRTATTPKYQPTPDGLTDAQRKAAEEYSRTGQIPRMMTEGREPFELGHVAIRAGYLRFRKVYGGKDDLLIS